MDKGNQWADHYTRRAKKEKWLARSVYKLEEIDRKYRLLRPGNLVLDLGCYPGSWSQYALRKVGAKGSVIGMDLVPPTRITAPNFRFVQRNVLDVDREAARREIGTRDVVLSDMAPQTSGIRLADAGRSVRLAETALNLALEVLVEGGRFVCKVFEGEDFRAFRNACARNFNSIRNLRPAAVRKGSREIYLIGLEFHPSSKT